MKVSNIVLDEFKRLILEHKFYEAHEVLEDIWFAHRNDKAALPQTIKSFINASVSFELFKRNKIKQSNKVWNNYLRLNNIMYVQDEILKDKLLKVSIFLDSFNKNYRLLSAV